MAALPPATVPNIRIAQAATLLPPTQPRVLQPILAPTDAAPAASPTSANCQSALARPRYQLLTTIDYAAKTAQVAQQISYPNRTGSALADLVLSVEPNQWEGAFALEKVSINGTDVPYTLQKHRLTLPLPQPLNADCEAQINLTFVVRPPRVSSGISSFRGYFGHGERQMNLAYWLPTIVPYINGEWLIHEPQAIGEQVVLEQADWDVTLMVNNAADTLMVAAPGLMEQPAPTTWRFVMNAARDFPLSLSEYYRLQTMTTASGVQVEVYSFPDAVRQTGSGLMDGGQHALTEATRALQQFAALFGAHPQPRLLIVQADFPDGMEFSGLVFVSSNWFYRFQGGFDNYLTVITVHEVSHQWWYARVGNDAALAPWLDEALATYSEYIYYEEFHPELKNWWWDFRVGWYNPQGKVDSTVYEFASPRDYINAIYLRGVQMLHNLREDMGTEAFFRLLAEYARVADGQIATPRLFWSLLSPSQFSATRDTRGQFLSDPDLIGAP